MRKILCVIFCFVFIISTAACGNFGKTLTEKYADIVKEYEDKYGIISKERNIFYSSDALGGLSYIDLIDFNNDGVDELVLIFDRCTYENVMEGALTCHIYAEVDGELSLVYDENLSIDGKYGDTPYMGRTLLLANESGQVYIVVAERETVELSDYPRTEHDYTRNIDETKYDYTFFYTIYREFDGSAFVENCRAGECITYSDYEDMYRVDGQLCSEEKYNSSLKDVTEYIECSTYFYKKILAHNNDIKNRLGLSEFVVEETTAQQTTKGEETSKKSVSTTQVITTTTTTSTNNTTATTPPSTTEAVTVLNEEPTTSKKAIVTVDEMASAIAAHYSAQRTDGGGFSCSPNEAMDMGNYYTFAVRYVRSPEEEAEIDRLFREEGIIPSANVIAFDVVVEKDTGKVTRTNDNDTWYLW